MRKLFVPMMCFALLCILTGCQEKYYRVTDNLSGKAFYTLTWPGGPVPRRGGGTSFLDLTTGDRVYLSSYSVAEVPASQVPSTQPAGR